MSKEVYKYKVFQTTKVRTALKKDGSWIHKSKQADDEQDKARADHAVETRPSPSRQNSYVFNTAKKFDDSANQPDVGVIPPQKDAQPEGSTVETTDDAKPQAPKEELIQNGEARPEESAADTTAENREEFTAVCQANVAHNAQVSAKVRVTEQIQNGEVQPATSTKENPEVVSNITAENKGECADATVEHPNIDHNEAKVSADPCVEDPAAETHAVETPAVDTPAIDTPAAETPVVDIPAIDTPAIDTPTIDTPAAETPAVDAPAIDTPAIDTPAVDTPAETPAIDTPAVDTPAETPAIDTPAVDTPAIDTPAVDTPAETPAIDTPAVDTPAIDTPAVDTPAIDTPAVDTPAINTPAIDTPAIDTPAVDTPAIDTPAIDTPAVDTPVINTPAVDTPAIDTPAIDTPAVETPVAYVAELKPKEEPTETEPVSAAVQVSVDSLPNIMAVTESKTAAPETTVKSVECKAASAEPLDNIVIEQSVEPILPTEQVVQQVEPPTASDAQDTLSDRLIKLSDALDVGTKMTEADLKTLEDSQQSHTEETKQLPDDTNTSDLFQKSKEEQLSRQTQRTRKSNVCSFCEEIINGNVKLHFSEPVMTCHPECLKCGVCAQALGEMLIPMFLHKQMVQCGGCVVKTLI